MHKSRKFVPKIWAAADTSAGRRPLLEVLRDHKSPMTPEELFRAAGYESEFKSTKYSQEVVDRFYLELRELTESPPRIRQLRGPGNVIVLEAIG